MTYITSLSIRDAFLWKVFYRVQKLSSYYYDKMIHRIVFMQQYPYFRSLEASYDEWKEFWINKVMPIAPIDKIEMWQWFADRDMPKIVQTYDYYMEKNLFDPLFISYVRQNYRYLPRILVLSFPRSLFVNLHYPRVIT